MGVYKDLHYLERFMKSVKEESVEYEKMAELEKLVSYFAHYLYAVMNTHRQTNKV